MVISKSLNASFGFSGSFTKFTNKTLDDASMSTFDVLFAKFPMKVFDASMNTWNVTISKFISKKIDASMLQFTPKFLKGKLWFFARSFFTTNTIHAEMDKSNMRVALLIYNPPRCEDLIMKKITGLLIS